MHYFEVSIFLLIEVISSFDQNENYYILTLLRIGTLENLNSREIYLSKLL